MTPAPDPAREIANAPLKVAASLVLVQGLGTILVAILDIASVDTARLAMGISAAAFFIVYGVGLLVCARGLFQARSFARGPVLLSQLIWLGVAWSFRVHPLPASVLAVSAAIVLAGVLHPRSIRILEAGHETD